MNVAILSDTLTAAGAEGVVQRLALGLARRGSQPFIYCLKSAGPAAERLRAGGVVVREAKSSGRDSLLVWRLTRWLRADRVDLVHAHSCAALVCVFPAAKLLGIPLLHVRHGWPLDGPSRYARLAERLSRWIDCVALNCESGRARLPRGHVARDAVCVPNGVDRRQVTRAAARELLEELCFRSLMVAVRPSLTVAVRTKGRRWTGPLVLSVANIRPEKDIAGLLHAFALLRREEPNAGLVCVGAVLDQGYWARVRRDVQRLGLEGCVCFPGRVEDAARLMRGADVFCLSSRTEGMPNVILEAMAQRVPIVATAVGDVGYLGPDGDTSSFLLRHNDTALLAPPGKPVALAAALRCALRDPQASATRAQRAFQVYARRYTTEHMVVRYERLYADAVAPASRRWRDSRDGCATVSRRSPSRAAQRSDSRRRPAGGIGRDRTRPLHGRRRPPAVVMLGPRVPSIGGMVTSIGLLMNSPLRARYELHRVGCPVDRSNAARLRSRFGPILTAEGGGATRLRSRFGRGADNRPPRGLRRATSLLAAMIRHLVAVAGLARLLVTRRIALLHIHTCSYFTFYRNLLDLVVAKLLRRAVVLHIRGGHFERFCAGSGRVGRWVIRHGLEAADAVIVLSQGWYDCLRPYAGNARLVVVPNAFDPAAIPTPEMRASVLRTARPTPASRPCRFLFLSAVSESKGVGDLIEAARLLHRAGTPFELCIAGPAVETGAARWEEQARAAGLEELITFTGAVNGPDKARLLASADCFVHPSHCEGLPNAVLEAGAAGLPVIATAVGALPEVLNPPRPRGSARLRFAALIRGVPLAYGRGSDQVNAVADKQAASLAPLVPPHDPPALAREMARLACDEALWREIGARLRERFLAEYSTTRLAERVSVVYERILSARLRSRFGPRLWSRFGPRLWSRFGARLRSRFGERQESRAGGSPSPKLGPAAGEPCTPGVGRASSTRRGPQRPRKPTPLRQGTRMSVSEWLAKRVTYPAHEWLCGRPTLRYYREMMRLGNAPRPKVQGESRQRLRSLLDFAAQNLPYYRDVFRQCGVDPRADDPYSELAKLPVLGKADIRANAARMVYRGVPGGLIPYGSGGTTGDTLRFFVDRSRQTQPLACRLFMQSLFGVRPGDRRAYLWGSPIEARAQRIKRWRDRFINELLLDAFDMGPGAIDRHLAAIRSFQPRLIYAYSSAAALLAKHAARRYRPRDFAWLRLVVLTGEEVTPDQVTRVRQTFGCAVASEYGSREVGLIAHECPRGGLHIMSPHVHVEIVREGAAAASGQIGEVLCTTLTARAQPFIHYRLGDVGRLVPEPCACGLPFPRMRVEGGKITGFVVLPDGRLCHGAVSSYTLRNEPGIVEFKTFQRAVDRFEVLLVVDRCFDHNAIARIQQRYRALFGAQVRVACHLVDRIPPDPSGKRRHVVSDVAPDSASFELVGALESEGQPAEMLD